MNWIQREMSGILLSQQQKITDGDVELINNLPNPPLVPVAPSDIHVRRCRLGGDGIDAGFGRFRTEDLPRLLEMVQGAPALIGHRKDTLGVARFFGGLIMTDAASGISYIVPKFYWMKLHSASEDLRVNIDGGIYCEASLGFSFLKPTCSICSEDIRRCEHMPGNEYDSALCFFYYDEILRVTEGSFVYRGAQPGTGFMLHEQTGKNQLRQGSPRFKWDGIWYRGYPEKLLYLEA